VARPYGAGVGKQELAEGVERRPDEPSVCTLRFWPDQPQPQGREEGRVVYRMALEREGEVRALVDIPLSSLSVAGHPDQHVRRVIGSGAARQLSRLAARGRLPSQPALMPLRLVGLDPHVVRLMGQGQLDLDPADAWTVPV